MISFLWFSLMNDRYMKNFQPFNIIKPFYSLFLDRQIVTVDWLQTIGRSRRLQLRLRDQEENRRDSDRHGHQAQWSRFREPISQRFGSWDDWLSVTVEGSEVQGLIVFCGTCSTCKWKQVAARTISYLGQCMMMPLLLLRTSFSSSDSVVHEVGRLCWESNSNSDAESARRCAVSRVSE